MYGHEGQFKTKERILQSYWWPGMDKEINDHLKSKITKDQKVEKANIKWVTATSSVHCSKSKSAHWFVWTPQNFSHRKEILKWVHNIRKFLESLNFQERKFLESLNFQERNLVLTGDPFLEYDPCTYVLVYSYPQQAVNYPAIQQALPHILQPTPQASPAPSPQRTPINSPPQSPTSPGSDQFFTPTNSPAATAELRKPTSLSKLIKKVLLGKTIEIPDPLTDRQSWIQKNLLKMQAKQQAK